MIISITGTASNSEYGRDADAYESSLDAMFSIIDSGPTTPAERKRHRSKIDAIIDADRPVPITASMRGKAVTLGGDKARSDLADVTARFWRGYARKHGALS